jgi:hypothetical protein
MPIDANLVWAVYERSDGAGYVVLALRQLGDGTYAMHREPLADIEPLPVSVHANRRAADRAAAGLLYDCAGTC